MAAVDYFLKIDGLPGESTDSKHKGEIDILSWSWGATNTGTHGVGSGGGAGKVVMNDATFTTPTNKSSPKLFLACATGQHIKSATLVCRKAGKTQQEYFKIIFSDLLISGYQTGGSGGTGTATLPTDQFTLNFTKIELNYAAQKSDGTLDSPIINSYDIAQQVGK
jgi:type VI secretion system secreted protein Hcp